MKEDMQQIIDALEMAYLKNIWTDEEYKILREALDKADEVQESC